MNLPRTIRDVVAILSALDPDMEVACVEDISFDGSGADLRAVAGFTVVTTGPIIDGERTDPRRVLVLVPAGGTHAARIAMTEPWWTYGTRYSGDAADEHVDCRRCGASGDRDDTDCPTCGFRGGMS